MRPLLGCLRSAARTAYTLLRREKSGQTVSRACLRHHARQEAQKGLDGVSWDWPIHTARNNSALFNTYRLRKKA